MLIFCKDYEDYQNNHTVLCCKKIPVLCCNIQAVRITCAYTAFTSINTAVTQLKYCNEGTINTMVLIINQY